MQFFIAITMVCICLFMVARGVLRSIFPSLFKAKTHGACCSGGCPALKTPSSSVPESPREHRPAA